MPASGRQTLPAPIPSATHHHSAAALKKGDDPILCPHFSISITSRGKEQSATAGASYYLGQKLCSEYDHEWKYPHRDPKRVCYTEVMLPPNAPPAYADHQTLWNAVDAVEKGNKTQTARCFTITLPRALTYEQNLDLMETYQNTNELSDLLEQTSKQVIVPNRKKEQRPKQHPQNVTP